MDRQSDVGMDQSSAPNITQLFTGKTVLVTGGTGFLGKVLVEKLLRSCPGIREVFLLIKPTTSDELADLSRRYKEYIENKVFQRLRKEQPSAINKLRILPGDITSEMLGLSDFHARKVITDVSFVFHCAANVRFDDDPRNTIRANLLGVKNVLDLCDYCQKLEALVHVSTAYSFCNRSTILEELYPELVEPEEIIRKNMWMPSDELRALCLTNARGRPSLYHFSKALAETLIVESNLDFPVIIVRPSIVTASVREPFPGWIDNHNGPSGFIAVSGKSIIRTLLVYPDVNADWVPVDIVANTLIVAAHYIAVKSRSRSTVKLSTVRKVPIINCTCPENNLITWMKVVEICLPFLEKYPSNTGYGKPGGTVTSFTLIYLMCRLFSHYIPAVFMDGVRCLMLKKPTLTHVIHSIHRVMDHLQYFTTHSFSFISPNMRRLVEQMEPEDAEIFPIDQSTLDWTQYIENYVLGVRRYFLKEDDYSLPVARKRMMRMHYSWLVLKVSSWFGICMLIRSAYQSGFKISSLSKSLSSLSTSLSSLIPFKLENRS